MHDTTPSARFTTPLVPLILAVAVALAGGPSLAQAGPRAASPSHVPDVVLVKFRSSYERARISPRLRAALPAGLASARPIWRPSSTRRAAGPVPGGIDRLYEVRVPAGTDVPMLAAKLSRLPEVEYAEPRYLYRLLEEPSPPGALATPSDPRYVTDQPYLGLIQVASAWDVVKGQDTDPLVCVVDGGTLWQHEDLLANMWTNPGEIAGNGVDDDGNGFVDDVHGWDFLADDGDPRGSPTTPSNADHGTHTGGLLAAVTNNAVGMASASWNPRLMAVNASASTDQFIAYGYEGILYAVDNGARIVSLSWGGTEWSQMGRDVVAYAVAQGALLLAAAGNAGNDVPFYPAAFPNVYGVVNVQHLAPATDVKRFSSNYGTWVDLCAPGTDILSTVDTGSKNDYALLSGTSMATPIAAAVAALIQSQHPAWSGLKVGEQLRATCDDIDAVNPGYAHLLGKGRVNAWRAVTESPPAVRLTGWSFADADGNGQLNRGETVTLSLDVHNYRTLAQNLTLSLVSASSSVVVVDGTEALGDLAEDQDATIPAAFSFTVAANAPLGARVDLRVDMTANGYGDFQWVPALIEPLYETHDANRLRVSLAATGSVGWIGFAGEPGSWKGDGLRYDGGPNVLFEGGLLVGTDATHLADAIRTPAGESQDFAPVAQSPPIRLTPGLVSDQETRMSFVDIGSPSAPLGVRVMAESRAFVSPARDDFALLGYRIVNTSAATLTGMRVGLLFDWDIDAAHFLTNRADWDAARGLGYAWDTTDPGLPWLGVMVLAGGAQTIYGAFPPANFTEADKWNAMTGASGTSTGPGDVANILSTGPFSPAPGDSVAVWFALLGGHDLAELQANADQARQLWSSIVAVEPAAPGAAMGLALGEPWPNPLTRATRVELRVDRARAVSAAVYDTRGRRVRTLFEREMAPGAASLEWDGRDDHGRAVRAGVYFLAVDSGPDRRVRKAVVLR